MGRIPKSLLFSSSLAICISLLLFVSGCVTVVLEQQGDGAASENTPPEVTIVENPPLPAPKPQETLQAPAVRENVSDASGEDAMSARIRDIVSSQQDAPAAKELLETAYANQELAKLRADSQRRGDVLPLDDFDPRDMLTMERFDVKKTSPSRGAVKEALFVIRNLGKDTIHPKIDLLIETDVLNPDFPRVKTTSFTFRDIPPRFKVEKLAYLNTEFQPLGYERKWEIRLLDKKTGKQLASKSGRFRLDAG